jgi:hypothetical protein
MTSIFKALWNSLDLIIAYPNTATVQMRDNGNTGHGVEKKVFRG